MTSSMYVALANIFNDAAKDERTRVVLWHGAMGAHIEVHTPMNDQLPDPDALLTRVQAEEAQQTRGKHKIFFGATAGVGKMLLPRPI